MLSGNAFGQRASILAAEVLTLIALGLSIAAILMSSWQVVNLREYNSIHEHGLWLDCTRHTRDGPNSPLARRTNTVHASAERRRLQTTLQQQKQQKQQKQKQQTNTVSRCFRYATITEPLHCVYKFDYDKYSGTFDLEDDNSPVGEVNRHKFYGIFSECTLSVRITST
uniref:Uncharacterized protein n=1 Tax=Syphacia muris TaxID=451379 RepID=A0A0N5AXI3_9BILA